MNTTNLFVELVVIGVGALVWVGLMVLAVTGIEPSAALALVSAKTAVPLLAFVYVLGIVTDRMADVLFERLWGASIRDEFFKGPGEYYDARRVILTESERLSDLLEYARSRLRICRGWSLSTVMILGLLDLLLWFGPETFRGQPTALLVTINAGLALLAVGTWYAWQAIVRNEYRKVKEQAAFLVGRTG